MSINLIKYIDYEFSRRIRQVNLNFPETHFDTLGTPYPPDHNGPEYWPFHRSLRTVIQRYDGTAVGTDRERGESEIVVA